MVTMVLRLNEVHEHPPREAAEREDREELRAREGRRFLDEDAELLGSLADW